MVVKVRIRLGLPIVLALVLGARAHAHDLIETGGKAYHWNPARASHMPNDPVPPIGTIRPGRVAPQYIVVLPNRWAVGQTLRVCFYGGNEALRARILRVAEQWLKYGNLKFDSGGP